MAKLEHLLLKEAGRTSSNDGKKNQNTTKGRLEDSDSDDGSDSKYIDDNDLDDAGTKNKKVSGSK